MYYRVCETDLCAVVDIFLRTVGGIYRFVAGVPLLDVKAITQALHVVLLSDFSSSVVDLVIGESAGYIVDVFFMPQLSLNLRFESFNSRFES